METRIDGRVLGEIRPLTCATGVLERADGSARWSQGSTYVMAAVYGPIEGNTGREQPDKAVIDVTYKARNPDASTPEKSYALALRQTLEKCIVASLHPRMLIHVVLQEMGSDGSCLACAFNAAVTALIHAGIPMNTMPVAVSVALRESDGQMMLDPTAVEEKDARAVGCFAYYTAGGGKTNNDDTSNNDPIMTRVEGKTNADTVFDMVTVSRLASEKLSAFMRTSVESDLQHLTATLKKK